MRYIDEKETTLRELPPVSFSICYSIWLDWFLFRYLGNNRFSFDFLKFGNGEGESSPFPFIFSISWVLFCRLLFFWLEFCSYLAVFFLRLPLKLIFGFFCLFLLFLPPVAEYRFPVPDNDIGTSAIRKLKGTVRF